MKKLHNRGQYTPKIKKDLEKLIGMEVSHAEFRLLDRLVQYGILSNAVPLSWFSEEEQDIIFGMNAKRWIKVFTFVFGHAREKDRRIGVRFESAFFYLFIGELGESYVGHFLEAKEPKENINYDEYVKIDPKKFIGAKIVAERLIGRRLFKDEDMLYRGLIRILNERRYLDMDGVTPYYRKLLNTLEEEGHLTITDFGFVQVTKKFYISMTMILIGMEFTEAGVPYFTTFKYHAPELRDGFRNDSLDIRKKAKFHGRVNRCDLSQVEPLIGDIVSVEFMNKIRGGNANV